MKTRRSNTKVKIRSETKRKKNGGKLTERKK